MGTGRLARLLCSAGAVLFLVQAALGKEVCVEECFCKLVGQVDDCCCDFNTVNETNRHILPVLEKLLHKPFFTFYKTNVFKPCPFWKDDGQCGRQSCALKECKPDELPFVFRSSQHQLDSECEDPFQDPIVSSVSEQFRVEMKNMMGSNADASAFWDVADHDDVIDPQSTIQPQWYNLTANPERFTGYIGDSAAQVWRLIYTENCFLPENKDGKSPFELLKHDSIQTMPIEKRTFFRIISGLHTSITTHVCSEFYDSTTGKWGPNALMFYKRFAPELTDGEGPWRLRNLFFTYLFVLRAIEKAEPYLERYQFYSGDAPVDEEVRGLVDQLLKRVGNVSNAFDETQMFTGDSVSARQLKLEFREKFQNITQVMDCVGCTKCRLWGKLQIQGLGTAIKILFTNPAPTCEGDVCQAEQHGVSRELGPIRLRRNEVVALFNTLGHLAESIKSMGELRKLTTQLNEFTPAPPKPVAIFQNKNPFGG
eukprot:comp21250_c1_seq1/m.28952 comp21250_c1_seq1/g.28952  ORF comp21250_c1_seq1/g.28952 comp21250_c1_seq1/m.28952 type:complete len:481 (-) comp21250_c1_seq1:214-1656(-)